MFMWKVKALVLVLAAAAATASVGGCQQRQPIAAASVGGCQQRQPIAADAYRVQAAIAQAKMEARSATAPTALTGKLGYFQDKHGICYAWTSSKLYGSSSDIYSITAVPCEKLGPPPMAHKPPEAHPPIQP